MRQTTKTSQPSNTLILLGKLAKRIERAVNNSNGAAIWLFIVLGCFAALLVRTIQNSEAEKASRLDVGAIERTFAIPVMSAKEFLVRTANNGYDDVFFKNVPDHAEKDVKEPIGTHSMQDVLRNLEVLQSVSFPKEV